MVQHFYSCFTFRLDVRFYVIALNLAGIGPPVLLDNASFNLS